MREGGEREEGGEEGEGEHGVDSGCRGTKRGAEKE